MVTNADELESSGWIIRDDTGLCPHCREEGRQLPVGADLGQLAARTP
jgi:hypothetical protein